MASRVPITVTVNGQRHAGEVEPRQLLVHFLRDSLGLTGTHVGCDTSNCGACTVHLDGDAVKSCTVLAVQADGAEVTTIEGMGIGGRPAPDAGGVLGAPRPPVRLLHARHDHGRRRPDRQEPGPDRGTRSARRSPATSAAAPATTTSSRRCCPPRRRRAGEEVHAVTAVETNGKWVGQALRRKEDPRMITGRGNYVDDMVVPGMLYMPVVRSPEAHAKIVSIDAAGARSTPASTASSPARTSTSPPALPMAWVPPGVEIKTPEHWPLAKGEVKYVGQGVAIVLGSDKYGVVDAAEQVLVEYEPLPVVVDPEKALEDGSDARARGVRHQQDARVGRSAAATWTPAWAEADVVIERRIVNHRTAGTPIEPRVCIADYRGGSAHAAPHEPEPAPDPALHGRRVRDVRGPHPRHRAGRRRRLRREDHPLPGGDPRGVGVAQARPRRSSGPRRARST